jgi:hypothetical protein
MNRFVNVCEEWKCGGKNKNVNRSNAEKQKNDFALFQLGKDEW